MTAPSYVRVRRDWWGPAYTWAARLVGVTRYHVLIWVRLHVRNMPPRLSLSKDFARWSHERVTNAILSDGFWGAVEVTWPRQRQRLRAMLELRSPPGGELAWLKMAAADFERLLRVAENRG